MRWEERRPVRSSERDKLTNSAATPQNPSLTQALPASPAVSHHFGLNSTDDLPSVSCLPGGSNGKESACNAGDPGSVPSQEDPLEEGMATPSSILAWEIPWTEDPGGLQSMGSQELDMTERLHFHFSLSCIGEGNGNPLQYSCLESPMDRGAWQATVQGVTRVGHD